jgi:hypothetical protein
MAESSLGSDVKAALAVAVFFTLVGVAIGDDTVGMLLSPLVVLPLIYAACKAPLRHSMLGIMFLALTLENPAENPACGLWKSPFWTVGALFLTHINKTVDIPVLGSMAGIDVFLIVLLLVAWYRKQTGSTIDRAGRVPTPEPLTKLALLSLVGTVWITVVGMARGGNFSMALWQIDKVIHLPIIFLLFSMGLRGPKDHKAVAKVIVGAALIKAILAVYIVNVVVLPLDENGEEGTLNWALTHNDSVLFAMAFVILVSLIMERVGKKATRLALVGLPILAMGMIANHRRMVWVQVALVFATLYFATPANPTKRKVKIASWILSPFISIYLSAGWDSKGGIFKPVQIIRSVVDPQSDGSTLWREMENYDILFTIRQYWILGTGYGNGYWEIVPLPAIDYTLERYLPHNSLLGMWCYCGVIGYTAITLLWGAGVYFAMRAYFASKKPTDRVAALTGLGSVLVYMVQCYGDIGLGGWTGVFAVGAGLAVSGKLAVSVGAWPSSTKPAKKPTPQPIPSPLEGQVA